MRQESTSAPAAVNGVHSGASTTEAEHFLAGLRAASGASSVLAGQRNLEDERVGRVMVGHLATHSQTTERLSLAIAVMLCFGLQGLFPNRILLPWMTLVVLAQLARTWVRRELLRTQATPERFLKEFRWTLVAVGVAWAIGPLFMMGTLTMEQVAVAMVLYAGLCAAATASLAPDLRSFTLFSISVMGPACVAIAWGGWSLSNRALIALAILFTVAMHVLARRGGAALAAIVRSQEALSDSQRTNQAERALLDALIRSAPTAIVAIDRGGRALGVNPAFQKLFGWGPTEVLGKKVVELVVPPDKGTEASDMLQRVFRGEVVTQDVVRCHRDGSPIPVRVSAARSDDTLFDAAFVLYEDRSAEVEAYQALQRAEVHYRDLVESSSDLVWKVDITGRWTFLNEATQEIYGVAPADLIGTGFGDRVDADRREADLGALLSVLQGNSVTDYETVHRAVDGTLRSLSFNGRPIRDASSCIIGAQGTARDVSERAAVRAALENARELALHNANDKTNFLANMSHEIRTPMNAVIGMIEILLSSDLNSEQRRHGEVIRSSAGALLTVIDDILDFSRLESNNVQVEAIPYGVRGLVESTTRLLEVQARKKGLDLSYKVDAAVPDRVVGDPGRIRQVLMNLIGNAIKFTHVGSVTVEVSDFIDSDRPDFDQIKFRVTDTGIGVPPDKIDSIFEHFTQADASTTRRYGGTGLGLAICRGFVTAMGGHIGAKSALGVGSEFSFCLPLLLGPETGLDAPGMPRFAGTRALVVDANSEDRLDMERLLLPLGVSLTCVANAQEAMDHVPPGARPRFDLVLLDRNVTGMDGFELAGKLRAGTGAHIPIVMLSSEPRVGEGARCRELGIAGYLPKPVSRGDLLEVIGRVISGDDAVDATDKLITRHSIAEARRSLHILLVEDNPLNQEVASALLQRRGHTVDVVECGTEAVRIVLQKSYDLVLMDIQLPGIDGVEATRRIRATSVGAELPIIALTAHAFGEERARSMAAGMNDFLTKPFRPHELFAAVEGWLPTVDRVEEPDASSPRDDGPPVDIATFRHEMREVGIESIVAESLALFQATAPQRMDALVGSCEASDLVAAAREAHGLKSAAGTIHATRLHSLLNDIEDTANAGDAERVRVLGQAADVECKRALEHLGRELEPAATQ